MEIEDKLVIAKVMDKIQMTKTRNKITSTEFLSMYQKEIIQKELKKIKFKNYLFFGGYEGAEGECLIIYPDKIDIEIVKKSLSNMIKSIKISLPKEVKGEYTHREYLGACMRSGLNRNRIGDIIVYEDGAYIIVLEENVEYISEFLKEKFNKSKIEIINYYDIEVKSQEFEEIKIRISSVRLDNFVSEIAKISRGKAEALLEDEKVYLNTKVENKASKIVKINDILVIRGKGKFIISEIQNTNKKGKILAIVKKYK